MIKNIVNILATFQDPLWLCLLITFGCSSKFRKKWNEIGKSLEKSFGILCCSVYHGWLYSVVLQNSEKIFSFPNYIKSSRTSDSVIITKSFSTKIPNKSFLNVLILPDTLSQIVGCSLIILSCYILLNGSFNMILDL